LSSGDSRSIHSTTGPRAFLSNRMANIQSKLEGTDETHLHFNNY
jgi:hypothetical protein